VSNVVCTHLDEIAVGELPPSVEGCADCLRTYVDEVAFVVDGIRGKTRIPPSPLLQ
jgi:hypothetical protein